MSFFMAFLLAIAFVFITYLYIAFAEKILRSNRTEAAEARWMLGGLKQFWNGQLTRNPSELGDYRATRGLALKKDGSKIVMQSTLSTEKFRAIYNR